MRLASECPGILCSEAPVEVLEESSSVDVPTRFLETYFATGYTDWLEEKLGRPVKVGQQRLNNAIVVLWLRACRLNTSRLLGRADDEWDAHFFSDDGLYD